MVKQTCEITSRIYPHKNKCMRHFTQSQEHTNSNELRKSFWDDSEQLISPHTNQQRKNSLRTSQSNSKQKKTRASSQDQGRRTTTGPGSPTKQKREWYKKQGAHHEGNNKKSQTNIISASDNSEQYYENTRSQTNRYRRVIAHQKVDQRRKKYLKPRARRVKNMKNSPKYQYIKHPRTQMYDYLSKAMNIPLKDCHFKKFTAKQCKQAIELSKHFVYSNQSYE